MIMRNLHKKDYIIFKSLNIEILKYLLNICKYFVCFGLVFWFSMIWWCMMNFQIDAFVQCTTAKPPLETQISLTFRNPDIFLHLKVGCRWLTFVHVCCCMLLRVCVMVISGVEWKADAFATSALPCHILPFPENATCTGLDPNTNSEGEETVPPPPRPE